MNIDRVGTVIVEELENPGNTVTGFFVSKLICNSIEELLKVDSTRVLVGVQIRDHRINGWVLSLETETLHGSLKFFGVDDSAAVCIKEREGFTDFLDLIFGESRSLKYLSSNGRFLSAETTSLGLAHILLFKFKLL